MLVPQIAKQINIIPLVYDVVLLKMQQGDLIISEQGVFFGDMEMFHFGPQTVPNLQYIEMVDPV